MPVCVLSTFRIRESFGRKANKKTTKFVFINIAKPGKKPFIKLFHLMSVLLGMQ